MPTRSAASSHRPHPYTRERAKTERQANNTLLARHDTPTPQHNIQHPTSNIQHHRRQLIRPAEPNDAEDNEGVHKLRNTEGQRTLAWIVLQTR
ncbi:hypothetical protein NPX13_g1230 [Xylaria arbuscula]|uniref:Uncharacterized protein n=1 Tax=Xylaria arbuscula TaxID=114810 RepID=A0A9W8TPU4_9PEZI|nr:hypothetical protein NPX13_g1230 [Xylaria arbuscula]